MSYIIQRRTLCTYWRVAIVFASFYRFCVDGQTQFEFARCGSVLKKKNLGKRSDKPVLIVVIQLHRLRVKICQNSSTEWTYPSHENKPLTPWQWKLSKGEVNAWNILSLIIDIANPSNTRLKSGEIYPDVHGTGCFPLPTWTNQRQIYLFSFFFLNRATKACQSLAVIGNLMSLLNGKVKFHLKKRFLNTWASIW